MSSSPSRVFTVRNLAIEALWRYTAHSCRGLWSHHRHTTVLHKDDGHLDGSWYYVGCTVCSGTNCSLARQTIFRQRLHRRAHGILSHVGCDPCTSSYFGASTFGTPWMTSMTVGRGACSWPSAPNDTLTFFVSVGLLLDNSEAANARDSGSNSVPSQLSLKASI